MLRGTLLASLCPLGVVGVCRPTRLQLTYRASCTGVSVPLVAGGPNSYMWTRPLLPWQNNGVSNAVCLLYVPVLCVKRALVPHDML